MAEKKKTYTLEDLQAIQRTVDPGKMRDIPRLLKGLAGPYSLEQLQGLPTDWMTGRSKEAWGQILSSLATTGIPLPGQKPDTPRYTPEGFDPGAGGDKPPTGDGKLPPGVPGVLAPGIKPPFSPLDPATLAGLLGNATTASPYGRGPGMPPPPPGMGGAFPNLLNLGQLLPQLMQGKGGPQQGPR